MKIVDFSTELKKRDQRLVTSKVIQIAETSTPPGNSRRLKQHFYDWLQLEITKIESINNFTQTTKQDIING